MRNLLFFYFFFFFVISDLFFPFFLPVNSLTFKFPNFLGIANGGNLILNDSANIDSIAGIIHLTPDDYNKMGRVIYPAPFNLWDNSKDNLADFTSHFSFKITGKGMSDYGTGDGFAFFLAPYPLDQILQSYSGGQNFGLFNAPNPSINVTDPGKWNLGSIHNKIVAVEFDTYSNYFDPPGNHIGIDIHSIFSVQYVELFNGTSGNFSLNRNAKADATVSYNASSMSLSVILSYSDPSDSHSNGLSWNLSVIVDLREYLPNQVVVGFSASTGGATESHTLLSWDFDSSDIRLTSFSEHARIRTSVLVLLITIAGVGVSLGSLGLAWFVVWWLRFRPSKEKAEISPGDDTMIRQINQKAWAPKSFSYVALDVATNSFASERKLGAGGFGSVYKGFLTEMDNLVVAIKRVSKESLQGRKEYEAEVTIISQLRHRNLVQLIGYCHDREREEFLLVYQYMPNRSLDYHLYDNETLIPWQTRYKIAVDLVSALLYLEDEMEQCVLHRDIKPSNVMLDAKFNAKLGDFGLARLINHDQSMLTKVLAGTRGYIAPEYASTGRASKESDVYSFGIVALELASGRKPIEFNAPNGKVILLDWIWELHERRSWLEAADKKLNMEFDEDMMQRLILVGLWCSHPDHKHRPAIKRVMGVLSFNEPLPEIPMTTSIGVQLQVTISESMSIPLLLEEQC